MLVIIAKTESVSLQHHRR